MKDKIVITLAPLWSNSMPLDPTVLQCDSLFQQKNKSFAADPT